MCFYINNTPKTKKNPLQIQTANSDKKFPLIWWRSSNKRKRVNQKKKKQDICQVHSFYKWINDLFTETKNFPISSFWTQCFSRVWLSVNLMISIKFNRLNWIQTLIQRFLKNNFSNFYIFTHFLIYLHHQIIPKLDNKLKMLFYFLLATVRVTRTFCCGFWRWGVCFYRGCSSPSSPDETDWWTTM